jgi:hypothetical protein
VLAAVLAGRQRNAAPTPGSRLDLVSQRIASYEHAAEVLAIEDQADVEALGRLEERRTQIHAEIEEARDTGEMTAKEVADALGRLGYGER